MTSPTNPARYPNRQSMAGDVGVIRPEPDLAPREAPTRRQRTDWRGELSELVRNMYRNPPAAIVIAGAAGLLLGILLKKCLPARTVILRRGRY